MQWVGSRMAGIAGLAAGMRLPRSRHSCRSGQAPAEYAARGPLAVHPHDPKVYLSGATALTDVPDDVTAVVTLCRVGREQVSMRLRDRHIEFRILDTTAADNPNLEYVIDDAARTVLRLRRDDETVLLHCVAARSRTPTVAARYAVLLGHSGDEALRQVCAALPNAVPNPDLIAALRRLATPHSSQNNPLMDKDEEHER